MVLHHAPRNYAQVDLALERKKSAGGARIPQIITNSYTVTVASFENLNYLCTPPYCYGRDCFHHCACFCRCCLTFGRHLTLLTLPQKNETPSEAPPTPTIVEILTSHTYATCNIRTSRHDPTRRMYTIIFAHVCTLNTCLFEELLRLEVREVLELWVHDAARVAHALFLSTPTSPVVRLQYR